MFDRERDGKNELRGVRRHNDAADLDKRLTRGEADEGGGKLVVLEGIYSMMGDRAPLTVRDVVVAMSLTKPSEMPIILARGLCSRGSL